ncbi:hypothetical protein K2173_019260 [Erythroxylum novogranatense]|uniref:Uncharacterized protein n=1 Tax=Erythroxylum novogranatense TaxID=1862640 RepID=A0AAV8ST68_9ROSI|nr:hypothetical protein K2173_019260 [Erythroxylum novogranatense]
MRVEIISRKLVSPSSPTPPHLRSLKISALDQLPAPIYPGVIFYYLANENTTERDKRLERSVSEALSIFYPLAGRYHKKHLLVDCQDQGVEYLEAHVSEKLSQVLHGNIQVEQLNHLVPFLVESDTSPLLAFQINKFECGGLAIGLRISHRIADGFTMTSFMSTWATTCRVGTHRVSSPGFCLSSLFPAKHIPGMTEDSSIMKSEIKVVTKNYTFDRKVISNLKAISTTAASLSGLLVHHQPTRLNVVTAFIWETLMKVGKSRRGYLRPSVLSHAVNMRGKTTLPIPEEACGNFFRQAIARFLPNDSTELHHLVNLVTDAIRNAISDCNTATNCDDLLSTVYKSVAEMYEETNNPEVDLYMFNSLCRMPVNDVDFGWGKPAWVSNVHKPFPIINLMDTRDDGIEAWLTLEEQDMILFEQELKVVQPFQSKSVAS